MFVVYCSTSYYVILYYIRVKPSQLHVEALGVADHALGKVLLCILCYIYIYRSLYSMTMFLMSYKSVTRGRNIANCGIQQVPPTVHVYT